MAEMLAVSDTSQVVPANQMLAKAGQYLTFVLSGEEYAMGILNIKEIIAYGQVTDVPMMPNFVRGIFNLRGIVVPVVDLMARFGKGVTQIAKRTGIVIVENLESGDDGQHYIGIIVDAVNEVVDILPQDIEPPPNFGTGIRQDFISGMAKRNDRFLILLNVSKVLSMDEMANLSKVAIDTIDGTDN